MIKDLQSCNNFVFLETIRKDEENYFSYLFLDPVKIIEAPDIDRVGPAFDEIDELVKNGYYAAGYVAYEAGFAFIKNILKSGDLSSFPYPLVWFGIYKDPVVLDHRKDSADMPWIENWNPLSGEQPCELKNMQACISEADYYKKIERIKNYLECGETYEINFTWNTSFSFSGSPFALYNDLKKKQSVSYAAFLKNDDLRILSFSPELFFRRTGDKIAARPMKGTIKRGRNLIEDEENIRRLRESKKDMAENIMIVDLVRNDLGKMCEPGSIKVNKLFDIEKYETVFQMTSTVEGRLRPGISYHEIFKNLFPCGSITGAPKCRSMEIIREVENDYRGIYTGAIGFIAPGDKAVFNIAIRTPVIQGNSGTMGIGGGIVWDSTPGDEYRESILKKEFLVKPVQEFKLLETILYCNGKYRLLSEHLERMAGSAEYFCFSFDAMKIIERLKQYAARTDENTAYRIRLLLDKRGEVSVEGWKLDIAGKRFHGNIALAGAKTNTDDTFLYHKTTNRSLYAGFYELAVKEGLADIIFINERGELTEGCISNIFIKREDELITPPPGCGLLNGIMRQYLLKKKKNMREDIISAEDLRRADAIYICNSVRGIGRVELVDRVLNIS